MLLSSSADKSAYLIKKYLRKSYVCQYYITEKCMNVNWLTVFFSKTNVNRLTELTCKMKKSTYKTQKKTYKTEEW